MKINFGHKITIAFTIFATMMIFMVVKSFRENIDLVTNDYYQEELDFQDQIEKKKNATKLGNPFSAILIADGINIIFDYKLNPLSLNGQIHLYRPSDAAFDKKYPISLSSENNQIIPLSDFKSGHYRLKLSYQFMGNDCYQELEINVP